MSSALKPDPSLIGGVPHVPLARLPDPALLFGTRAERFDFLATHAQNLGPYLRFLAGLSRAQAMLAAELAPGGPPDAAQMAQARAAGMPPLDRNAMRNPLQLAILRLCDLLADAQMPQPARLALAALRDAEAAERDWVMANVLSDQIPADSAAPHLFAAAALQVVAAQRAALLHVEQLAAIGPGICPACGGRPASSLVTENIGAEGTRYCSCATCQTLWNEVRVKCICCGSTAGITYRSVETEDATVKAECCRDCGNWVKILYQNKNPTLDPIADDVASLGLDLMMRASEWQRGGYNPFLTGY